MQTFTQALIELVVGGEVDRDVAANAATNRHDFLIAVDHALKRQAASAEPQADAVPEPEPEEAKVPPLRGASPSRPVVVTEAPLSGLRVAGS